MRYARICATANKFAQQKTRRNEATINHERFAYPQFRIPIEAHLEDTVPWYRIGGSLVIGRDFIHPIPFY